MVRSCRGIGVLRGADTHHRADWLIWSKAFVQLRYRGADIAHVILKQSDQIDWKRLLGYMELYWEVLLMRRTTKRVLQNSFARSMPATPR